MSTIQSTRRWFYLNGYWKDIVGNQTTDPGNLAFPSSAWNEYDPDVSFLLGDQYSTLLANGCFNSNNVDSNHGNEIEGTSAVPPSPNKILDLGMFTTPPLPYSIWKGSSFKVTNPLAPPSMFGKNIIGGFDANFWDRIASVTKEQPLPKNTTNFVEMGYGKMIGGFYQLAHESEAEFDQLMQYYCDSTGHATHPTKKPRCRIVICIEFQAGLFFPGQYVSSSLPTPPPDLSGGGGGGGGVSSPVNQQTSLPTPIDGIPVYEWWFGDRGEGLSSSNSKQLPRGMWRSYHPRVCAKIEAALHNEHDSNFRDGKQAVDVDGARYMIRRLTPEIPYIATALPTTPSVAASAAAQPSSLSSSSNPQHESIDPALFVSVKHPSFEDMDLKTNNCFIQYHKNNPLRWRVARRRTSPEEIARNALKTGDPCTICYSDEGELTGI